MAVGKAGEVADWRWPGFLLMAAVGFLAAWPGTAAAAERWKIVVVGEPAAGSLSIDHPAWRGADQAITRELSSAGYDVLDKVLLGLRQDCGGSKCSSGQLEEYRRQALEQSASNLIVSYDVILTSSRSPALEQWHVRVNGRMVDLATAGIVDRWDSSTQTFSDLEASCKDSCKQDWQARKVAEVARETGVALTAKLKSYVREFEYKATFVGFSLPEMRRLQGALLKSKGYGEGGLRLLTTDSSQREWLHSRATRGYEFRTPLDGGTLNQLLEDLLDKDGIRASVGYPAVVANGERRFEVRRGGLPYLQRYVTAFLALLALIGLSWAALDYRRNERLLDGFAQSRSPRAGMEHLQQLGKRPLPLWPRWQSLSKRWREQNAEVDAALQRATSAVEASDFEAATAQLELAREIDPEHAQVQTMLVQLPKQQKARELLAEACAQLESDASSAAKALTRALELDPGLSSVIRPWLDRAQDLLRRGLILTAQKKAEWNLNANKPYAALSVVGSALNAIRGLDDMRKERDSLQRWVETASATIEPMTGPAIGTGLLAGLRILVGDCIDIGRGSAAVNTGIGVGYKRASRLGKQTRLQRDRGGLMVEDVGSANGSLLDGQLLTPHKPARLHRCHELAIGGQLEAASAGACRLRITIAAENGRSARVDFDRSIAKILNPAELAPAWPNLRDDLLQTWLLLADPVPLALNDHLFPALDGEPPVMLLGYEDGFFVMPANGDSSTVHIYGEPLTTRVPLAAGVSLGIGDRSFGLESW